MRYFNIVSPDICSYRRFNIMSEHPTIDAAKAAYDADIVQFKASHKGVYAYATIGIDTDITPFDRFCTDTRATGRTTAGLQDITPPTP